MMSQLPMVLQEIEKARDEMTDNRVTRCKNFFTTPLELPVCKAFLIYTHIMMVEKLSIPIGIKPDTAGTDAQLTGVL
jgi:hypothetical protein